eukprot:3681187-Pleurochrysis_carterae.AAC.2
MCKDKHGWYNVAPTPEDASPIPPTLRFKWRAFFALGPTCSLRALLQGCTVLDSGVWMSVPRPLLQTLIEHGAVARGANPHGDTLLHTAVKSAVNGGERVLVDQLVGMGGDCNI